MSGKTDLAAVTYQAGRVARAIGDYLEALPPAEWARPSACAGWSVSDLVGHLILVEALIGGSVERGLRGDSGPPPQAAAGLAAWQEYRAAEIARLGGLAPAELAAAFRAGLGSVEGQLARLAGGEGLGQGLRGWHPWAIQPLEWFPGQWLVELGLHDWDIRVAADPRAEVSPAVQAGLGPEMRARMARCFRQELADGASGVVRIQLVGDRPTAWLARLAEGELTLLDDGQARPDATLEADPGTYALVQTGRRSAGDLGAGGRWRVTGDERLVEKVVAAFRGY